MTSRSDFFSLSAWWSWFKAKFTLGAKQTADLTVQVVNTVGPLIPEAIKVVAWIDTTIKESLKDQSLSSEEIESLLSEFLRSTDIQASIADHLAKKFSVMPIADVLLNLAAVLIQRDRAKIAAIGFSLARTAAQMAYEIYVLSKGAK